MSVPGSVPFVHFFDGFRTSHELQKIEVMDYDEIGKLIDEDALRKFRKSSLNPERPVQRSTVQNPAVFFQNREACRACYHCDGLHHRRSAGSCGKSDGKG